MASNRTLSQNNPSQRTASQKAIHRKTASQQQLVSQNYTGDKNMGTLTSKPSGSNSRLQLIYDESPAEQMNRKLTRQPSPNTRTKQAALSNPSGVAYSPNHQGRMKARSNRQTVHSNVTFGHSKTHSIANSGKNNEREHSR